MLPKNYSTQITHLLSILWLAILCEKYYTQYLAKFTAAGYYPGPPTISGLGKASGPQVFIMQEHARYSSF